MKLLSIHLNVAYLPDLENPKIYSFTGLSIFLGQMTRRKATNRVIFLHEKLAVATDSVQVKKLITKRANSPVINCDLQLVPKK